MGKDLRRATRLIRRGWTPTIDLSPEALGSQPEVDPRVLQGDRLMWGVGLLQVQQPPEAVPPGHPDDTSPHPVKGGKESSPLWDPPLSSHDRSLQESGEEFGEVWLNTSCSELGDLP